MNYPDRWCIVKVTKENEKPTYKVFATWYGGVFGKDEWKLNSGITKVKDDGFDFVFHGVSGSMYSCNKLEYGLSRSGSLIYKQLERLAEDEGTILELMPEDTDFLKVKYV